MKIWQSNIEILLIFNRLKELPTVCDSRAHRLIASTWIDININKQYVYYIQYFTSFLTLKTRVCKKEIFSTIIQLYIEVFLVTQKPRRYFNGLEFIQRSFKMISILLIPHSSVPDIFLLLLLFHSLSLYLSQWRQNGIAINKHCPL